MINNRILIIDELHESIEDLLTDIGFIPVYRPDITREEIIVLEEQYIGLIVRSKTTVDQQLLKKQKELRFVARAGAGIDQLDGHYLESRAVEVFNAPGGNRDALGEHVIGMLLSLSNQLRKSDLEVRSGVWDREGNRGFEICGKTIALLGYGFMGSAVAEKLSGFGCRVIAYDKHKTNFTDLYVEEVSMKDIFAQADVFSLHVPFTKENNGLVNADYLKKFRKQIVFINASRGEVVDLKDLLDALDRNQISAAALDVLENEKLNNLDEQQKLNFQRLIEMGNVLLSPHVGGWSLESYRKINEVMVKKIEHLKLI